MWVFMWMLKHSSDCESVHVDVRVILCKRTQFCGCERACVDERVFVRMWEVLHAYESNCMDVSVCVDVRQTVRMQEWLCGCECLCKNECVWMQSIHVNVRAFMWTQSICLDVRALLWMREQLWNSTIPAEYVDVRDVTWMCECRALMLMREHLCECRVFVWM